MSSLLLLLVVLVVLPFMDSYTFPLFGLPSKEPMVVPIGLVLFGWRLKGRK